MKLLKEKIFPYKEINYHIKLHEDDTHYFFTVTDERGDDIIFDNSSENFSIKPAIEKKDSNNKNKIKDEIGIETMFKYFEGIITLAADQKEYDDKV